jgi:hypothetical protein
MFGGKIQKTSDVRLGESADLQANATTACLINIKDTLLQLFRNSDFAAKERYLDPLQEK